MANSPVQIILNTNDFIEVWDRNPGGSNKDFFAGSDSEFISHRDKIQKQLHEIRNLQVKNEYAPVSYAKVTLQQSAIAKSHRPTQQLFKRDVAPIVGAGDLGELFIELTPQTIDKISSKVESAETETRYKTNKAGKVEPNPTRIRSEIGAVSEIISYSSDDKRKFSPAEALEWLKNPLSAGAYIVELFDSIPLPQNRDVVPAYKLKMFDSFIEGLKSNGPGIIASRLLGSKESGVIYGIKLDDSIKSPIVQLMPNQSSASKAVKNGEPNLNLESHTKLLQFLDLHPLVKKILLPPIISSSSGAETTAKINEKMMLPKVDSAKSYPKLCIVDGGVSDILGDWVEDRWGLVSPADKDEEHGTFIAGLSIVGQELNGTAVCREIDGCKIIDLDILPTDDKFSSYYSKPLEFFDELKIAVQDIKARTGVRIFNFSLNIKEHVSTSGYSLPAQILDKIAEDNDVIFVIAAGNTLNIDRRKEWPKDHFDAITILASSRNDALKKPAESCRNISVSAVNPPNHKGVIPYAFSNYSCRGPGLRIGLKPDLAHVSGAGTKDSIVGHGLLSLSPSGEIVDGCGTSYATPQVAKTLASLDHSIEGGATRETLLGLLIHNAVMPECLNDKKLRSVTKDLVGFGIPEGSEGILDGNPNAITLVFANRSINKHKMSFKFSWPASLVKSGKCYGHAKLTIVSSPTFDYKYGAEFVRINIEGALRQQQKDGKYLGRLKAIYTPEEKAISQYEKDQIEHSFKWSPVKVYEKTFSGVGPSTDWELAVEYLARDGASLPSIGIPFTAILTISDPKGEEPVFNDMRQTLQSLGVNVVDIKTAARIKPRT